MFNEIAKDYAIRRKRVIEEGVQTRGSIDWNLLCGSLDFYGFFTGSWKGITLPTEGYRELARFFGDFVRFIEDAKRLEYEKQRIRFDEEVIYGDPEDQGESC